MASEQGLSTDDAAARLAEYGPNRLPSPLRRSAGRRFLDQLTHFFALMLWSAAALAFVAGIPQLGMAIVVVVVLNAVFAFVQESRADRAADKLRELLPLAVPVIRDGRVDAQLAVDAGSGSQPAERAGSGDPGSVPLRRCLSSSMMR